MRRGRPTWRLPERGRGARGVPALVALVLHVVVAIVVVRTVTMPVLDFLRRGGDRPVEERVTYVVPAEEEEPAVPPPPMLAERPTTAGAPPTRAGAPLPVLPTPPSDTGSRGVRPPAGQGGAATADGRQVFGTGVEGLSTGRVDPRLVAPPGIPDGPVRNPILSPDVYVDAWVAAFWDSVATAQASRPRAPGDWTFDRGDGTKFGMDQSFIYFGKFKLPTALLALLPINAQANPSMVERNRALMSMKYEIDFHAQRAANEAEFRKAVDELRARRERERQQKQQNTPPRAGVSGSRVPPDR
jgi:hypothetical protein